MTITGTPGTGTSTGGGGNTAPVLAPIGAKSVNELATLTFTISATDADLPAQTLTYLATGFQLVQLLNRLLKFSAGLLLRLRVLLLLTKLRLG